jgi:nitric oxide reductase NorD protein
MPRRFSAFGALKSFLPRVRMSIGAAIKPVVAKHGANRRRTVRLDDVRRRLELLVTAVFDRPIPITVADPPRTKLSSFWSDPFGARHLMRTEALATTDGERIQLPREITGSDPEAALAEYRVMAMEQAERIARGTMAGVAAASTQLERDMYLVREGEIVDAAIARAVPGLRGALVAARARALGLRPSIRALTRAERAVETKLRESLRADLTSPTERDAGARTGTPDESLHWARSVLRDDPTIRGRYRGIAPVGPWGTVKPWSKLPHERLEQADELATLKGSKYGVGKFGHGQGKGGRQSSDNGKELGKSKASNTGQRVPQNDGEHRAMAPGASTVVGDESDHEFAADRSNAPNATEGSDEQPQPVQPSAGAAPARRMSRVPAPKPVVGGIEYPEWDWEAGDYREVGAVVRPYEPAVVDDAWGNAILARYGPLVRRLRERFERLRARRVKLNQQRDGDELDLSAVVRAIVDQRTGHTVDDRLYISVRPARRGLAIALLIDISGSTDEWVDAKRRVIDVEKVALLLASEALDALGDRYAVLTFSGKGRGNVRMRTIKAFDETNGSLVRQRIGALEPEGYTRAGAAIRHAAALLEKQPAAHRLLLIISDGKPNDVDAYERLSGVEDTRQSINEVRAAGVYPFCLTIDRQGQDYLGRIFGEAGHTILRNPQQLPMALVKVVKHLLAS